MLLFSGEPWLEAGLVLVTCQSLRVRGSESMNFLREGGPTLCIAGLKKIKVKFSLKQTGKILINFFSFEIHNT